MKSYTWTYFNKEVLHFRGYRQLGLEVYLQTQFKYRISEKLQYKHIENTEIEKNTDKLFQKRSWGAHSFNDSKAICHRQIASLSLIKVNHPIHIVEDESEWNFSSD